MLLILLWIGSSWDGVVNGVDGRWVGVFGWIWVDLGFGLACVGSGEDRVSLWGGRGESASLCWRVDGRFALRQL
jgi:hypothetical protein